MATEQSSNGADTVSITEMMRQMLEDHQKRDAELAEDRRRREEEITEEHRRQRQENDECMQEMRNQVAMLQRLVTERSTPTARDIRLSDLMGYWAKDCTGAAGVLDLIVKEQLLSALPEDARLWVSERKPKTSKEAGQLAEDFLQVRQSVSRTPAKPFGGEPPCTPCPKCGQAGHWACDCLRARSGGSAPSKEQAAKQEREAPPVRCYNCKQRGHVATKCPSNAALFCQGEEQANDSTPQRVVKEAHRHGIVEGVHVSNILLDTCATRSMIREDLLPPDHRVDGEVTVRCAHGNTVVYPLTEVAVEIGSRQLVVTAGVSRTLPVPMLLGREVPDMMQLLEEEDASPPEPQGPEPEDVLAVTTRGQKRNQEHEAALTRARELEDDAQPSPTNSNDDKTPSGA